MYSKRRILIFLVLLAILGCDNDDSIEENFDCYRKENNYNSNGELESWYKSFYKEGNLVEHEESNGSHTFYEYDIYGNQTTITNEFCCYEYKYDNLSNLVLMKYYESNILKYHIIYEYSENQKDRSFRINSSNDTLNISNYYYQAGRLSHIKSTNQDSYFYYSSEVDSIIELRKDKSILSKTELKYLDENLVYKTMYRYSSDSEIAEYYIDTWEYNNDLLIRKTEKESSYLSDIYSDIRFYYNEQNQRIKTESYDEFENLMFYGLFLYDEYGILYRSEGYNLSDELVHYSLIKDSCN